MNTHEQARARAHKRGHGAYHFAKSATSRKMKNETILADEVGGAYRRGFYEAKTEDEALKGGGTNVLSRLTPSQRISIDVEMFEGKATSYATLYDRNLETPENEEGFVAAAEVLDNAALGAVLAKLFENPDVGSL